MSQDTSEKIEILSLDLFDTHQEEMGIVEKMQQHFNSAMGWHYYLDLAWIIKEMRALQRGAVVLDAGAGSGLSQFILSELGYNVISCDFADRSFSEGYMERYGGIIHYLNNQEQTSDNRYVRHLKTIYNSGQASRKHSGIDKILRLFKREKAQGIKIDPVSTIERNRFIPKDSTTLGVLEGEAVERCGRIFLYTCDLKNMPMLPDGFVDAVVSVSALEHNDHADFEKCIDEILRVTKPSGRLAVTISASQSEDWFHEPSKGWCYSEASIKSLFRLPADVSSNSQVKDKLFEELRKEGNELHKKLSPFYFKSGDNGMPWGIWDPKYQPVGVVKVKP